MYCIEYCQAWIDWEKGSGPNKKKEPISKILERGFETKEEAIQKAKQISTDMFGDYICKNDYCVYYDTEQCRNTFWINIE